MQYSYNLFYGFHFFNTFVANLKEHYGLIFCVPKNLSESTHSPLNILRLSWNIYILCRIILKYFLFKFVNKSLTACTPTYNTEISSFLIDVLYVIFVHCNKIILHLNIISYAWNYSLNYVVQFQIEANFTMLWIPCKTSCIAAQKITVSLLSVVFQFKMS